MWLFSLEYLISPAGKQQFSDKHTPARLLDGAANPNKTKKVMSKIVQTGEKTGCNLEVFRVCFHGNS